MALRATSTARPPSLPSSPPLSPQPKTATIPSKSRYHLRGSINWHLLLSHSHSVPATAVLPLFALFAAPNESRSKILPKEQIVSSVTQVESAIDQIREVGSSLLGGAGQIIGAVTGAVKPGVDVALPILKQAGEQALKIASPVVSEASKKAQEAIQSSSFDTQPLLTAAKGRDGRLHNGGKEFVFYLFLEMDCDWFYQFYLV